MRIVVVGAGVIGVTSAYFLSRLGHQVTVLDANSAAGSQTSFANAGQISPGYATPWASPGLATKALKWLCSPRSPLIFTPSWDWAMYRWLYALWRNCDSNHYETNKRSMLHLACYSRDCLEDLTRALDIAFDHQRLGTLQLFRNRRQFDDVASDLGILRQDGIRFDLLDAEACRRIEPGLGAASVPLAGGIRLLDDETGDCHKFTLALTERAATTGVDFRFNMPVRALYRSGRRIAAAATDSQLISGDLFLIAAGCASPALLAPLGIRVPIYPVKGYSLTAKLRTIELGPQSTVMDEQFKVAITRLGERVRIGGTAEISGYGPATGVARHRLLALCARELFGDMVDWAQARAWGGLRPSTPHGPPLIGQTAIDNLFLNAGHGTLGWTMACGSGRLIADIMSGHPPEIDPSRYRIN